jgi:hypothetical protein
MHILK